MIHCSFIVGLLSYINPPNFSNVLASSLQHPHLIPSSPSPSSPHINLTFLSQSPFQPDTTTMARKKDLGTSTCCAEYRAWMAVYLKRVIAKKSLKKAFDKQFPDNKLNDSFYYHRGLVRNCKDEVRSQLLDLAKGFSW